MPLISQSLQLYFSFELLIHTVCLLPVCAPFVVFFKFSSILSVCGFLCRTCRVFLSSILVYKCASVHFVSFVPWLYVVLNGKT